jgi:hypothetical protein
MGLFFADYEDQEPQVLDFVVQSFSLMAAHHIQLRKIVLSISSQNTDKDPKQPTWSRSKAP